MRQKKNSEAAERSEEIVYTGSGTSFIAGIKGAELLNALDKIDQAETLLVYLIEHYENHPDLDQALFLLGELKTDRQNYQEGLRCFREILLNHPSSFYLEQAREAARELTTMIEESNNK